MDGDAQILIGGESILGNGFSTFFPFIFCSFENPHTRSPFPWTRKNDNACLREVA